MSFIALFVSLGLFAFEFDGRVFEGRTNDGQRCGIQMGPKDTQAPSHDFQWSVRTYSGYGEGCPWISEFNDNDFNAKNPNTPMILRAHSGFLDFNSDNRLLDLAFTRSIIIQGEDVDGLYRPRRFRMACLDYRNSRIHYTKVFTCRLFPEPTELHDIKQMHTRL